MTTSTTDPLVDCPNTTNLLTRAIYTADIDAACLLVQDALGITDGGLAGMVLPGPDEWKAAVPEVRQTWLGEWLHAEVIHAI